LTKIILRKTTKYSAIFLAAILVAGTIALSNSSFMVGAQAQQYYGMDQRYNSYEPDYGMDRYDDKQSYEKDNNSYDKSKDSSHSVSVKKIKCNNINVNVNGFNGVKVGTLPTALTGLATNEAQASADGDEIGASSFGSGGSGSDGRPSGSDNDSRFVCINNNDFAVVEEEEEPAISKCEKCFSALQTVIENLLMSSTDDITISIVSNGVEEKILIPGDVDTIQQLCPLLEGHTDLLVSNLFNMIVGDQTGATPINALVECLLKAGVLIEATP
jgi:hypothetical protein